MVYRKEVAEDVLTGRIIECGINVHRALGAHQPEGVYRNAMKVELEDVGLSCEVERGFEISYKGQVLGSGYVDLLVNGEVVVELKAVARLTEDHYAQLGRNVRGLNTSRGLLINFGQPTIRIRRYVNGYENAAQPTP
ncbi:MAG: GxxExxY protein [Bradymonadaceae bacterium]